MDATPMFVGSCVGTGLIVLGFLALLAQKIYIDAGTLAPSEIEIPLLGKMKANFPALIFVFLGAALVVVALKLYTAPAPIQWTINGQLVSDAPGLNWQNGQLALFPRKFDMRVDPDTGRFLITIDIEPGKTFEDVVEKIDYSHPKGSVQINTQKELELLNGGNKHQLIDRSATTRTYLVRLVSLPEPLIR